MRTKCHMASQIAGQNRKRTSVSGNELRLAVLVLAIENIAR